MNLKKIPSVGGLTTGLEKTWFKKLLGF